MTIAPTHQMMLFIACSYVGDRFYRWNAPLGAACGGERSRRSRGERPEQGTTAPGRDQANSTVNLVQSPPSPRSIRSSPPICAAREETRLIPRPLQAVGSKPSGRTEPALHTDRAWPFPDGASVTVICPLPCLMALVTSSLTMRLSGMPMVVGRLSSIASTARTLIRALLRHRHRRMVATEPVEVWLEVDGRRAVHGMEMVVQARDRPHAVGRRGQARSGLGIRFPAALQRQQGNDHLQVVQQPVMALLGQHLLLADRGVLLAKQYLVAGESFPQLAFRGFVRRQLAFVARSRALRRAFEAEQRGDARA